MAYTFKPDESVPEAIRRVALEQIEGALESLAAKPPERDEAVHDARKRIKKLRALLRLVQRELGEAFASENIRLRDVGRNLSLFRDAVAMIETFDALRQKRAKDFAEDSLESVRQGLVTHKTRAEQQENIKAVMQAAARELRSTRSRVKQWPLHDDGFPAIAPGIEKTFRRGRLAMETAEQHPTAENFHAWRKRVKDYWYHVRLLNGLWPDVMTGLENSLKCLEDALGMDHNLNVLSARIDAEPAFFGTPEQIDSLRQAIAHFQKQLREEARPIGLRIYGEKPKEMRRRLEHWWSEWKANAA